jgi:hypothetical protein
MQPINKGKRETVTMTTDEKLAMTVRALEALVAWCEQPNPEIGGCRRVDTEHNTGGFAAYKKAVRAIARAKG